MQAAILEALHRGVPHPNAMRVALARRREHAASHLRVLPYAVCRLQRSDSQRKFHNDRIPGTVRFRAGKRTAQRYTYSPYFPQMFFDHTSAAFFGGNFWDGRSTGYLLQNPDAEQAQHPPVDTQEMGFPDTACIAFRLAQAEYRSLFELVWVRALSTSNSPRTLRRSAILREVQPCSTATSLQ
jgi:cytochrome c peroxidase